MNAPARTLHDTPRSDWTRPEIEALFALPFAELMFRAMTAHRTHFAPNEVQVSTLLSIKTGGCPEDCAYCPQAAKYDTGVKAGKLMDVESVLADAARAMAAGATRFCMGAAWRSPKDKDLDAVCEMIEGVKALGLESCVTLGMLTGAQARRLKGAGLDYYNHNLDTSLEYYGEIISTRTYADRLETLAAVRGAGVKVCCGGIVGMGESEADRAGLILALATLAPHPESVPVNALVAVEGTPAAKAEPLDGIDFVRMIAVARITMPRSMVRLSAGREAMSEETQALCFLAGANSIFYGEKLLTTPNPETAQDQALFERLGLETDECGLMLRKPFLLLMIVLVGAAMLAPVIMPTVLDRMPYDYDLVLDERHYLIPVTYSLCASVVAGLFYLVVKR